MIHSTMTEEEFWLKAAGLEQALFDGRISLGEFRFRKYKLRRAYGIEPEKPHA